MYSPKIRSNIARRHTQPRRRDNTQRPISVDDSTCSLADKRRHMHIRPASSPTTLYCTHALRTAILLRYRLTVSLTTDSMSPPNSATWTVLAGRHTSRSGGGQLRQHSSRTLADYLLNVPTVIPRCRRATRVIERHRINPL